MTKLDRLNQEPWLHYLALKHCFAHKIARENLSFHVFLTVVLFPKNIQSNFTLSMPLKKIEMTIPTVNYISQS